MRMPVLDGDEAIKRIRELETGIAQIRERDAALADALARLVNDFEYDKLLTLI